MSTTATLEALIREKARKELLAKIEAEFKGAAAAADNWNAISSLEHQKGNRVVKGKTYLTFPQLIQEAKETAYRDRVKKAEDRAVEAFLHKVESLQAQLDELQLTVEQQA